MISLEGWKSQNCNLKKKKQGQNTTKCNEKNCQIYPFESKSYSSSSTSNEWSGLFHDLGSALQILQSYRCRGCDKAITMFLRSLWMGPDWIICDVVLQGHRDIGLSPIMTVLHTWCFSLLLSVLNLNIMVPSFMLIF